MTTPRGKPPVAHTGTADRLVSTADLLSAAEAAQLLSVSPATITRKVRDGVLVPFRTDPLLFVRDDVAALRRAGT